MVHDHTETCREQALAALRDAQAHVDDLQQQEYQSRLARALRAQLHSHDDHHEWLANQTESGTR